VSSEQGPNGIRAYTVRVYDPVTRGIETIGEFNSLSRCSALTLALNTAFNETNQDN